MWAPSWSHDPIAACTQWSTNHAWGALKGGETIKQACASSFGRSKCAKTCCELVGPDPNKSSPSPEASAAEGTHGAFAIRKNFYACASKCHTHLSPHGLFITVRSKNLPARVGFVRPAQPALVSVPGRPADTSSSLPSSGPVQPSSSYLPSISTVAPAQGRCC
eukprot:SAG11_NODE_11144_length_781_cov_1.104106_2_plen_163_part_00